MPNPKDCRDHAFKCSRLAETFADGPTRQMFVDMAQTWLKRANDLEKSEKRLDKLRSREGTGSYRFGSAVAEPEVDNDSGTPVGQSFAGMAVDADASGGNRSLSRAVWTKDKAASPLNLRHRDFCG